MSKLLHEVNASVEPGTPESQRHPSLPTVVAMVLTTRPWPIHQKQTCTSWVVPHISYKQWVLTPGHQGWNDLHSLCRIGMKYYLLNNNNNDNDNNNDSNNNNKRPVGLYSSAAYWNHDDQGKGSSSELDMSEYIMFGLDWACLTTTCPSGHISRRINNVWPMLRQWSFSWSFQDVCLAVLYVRKG